MRKDKIEIDGHPVWFIHWGDDFLVHRRKLCGDNDGICVCAISHEPLTSETGVYGAWSNNVLFPNCSVSKKLVDTIGYETATQKIIDSWQAAQKFAHWFI